jgi:hypothetical protein
MKKLGLFILFSFPTFLYAQSEASWSDIVKSSPTDRQTAILGLSQLGIGSSSTPSVLPQNDYYVIQNGNGNNFNLNINGSGAVVSGYQQGTGNNMDLNLSGNNGELNLSQVGSGNSLLLSNNINQSNLEVTQLGNNNGLVSSGTITPTVLPLKIEQSGGMQISITHNY